MNDSPTLIDLGRGAESLSLGKLSRDEQALLPEAALSTDTPFLREIDAARGPAAILDTMRGNFTELINTSKNARDAIAFMDAHKVYIQFGGNKPGDGYIAFDEGGWDARMVGKEGGREKAIDEPFPTLEDALNAYVDAYYWATKP